MFKMLTYKITTKFGAVDSVHPAPHTGTDLACPVGTPAQAISDGVIAKVGNDPALGEYVRVSVAGGREWVYGHLSGVNVATGQQVNTGDVLGLTGGVPGTIGAGNSTGEHLHLSLLQNGKLTDPMAVIGNTDSGGLASKLWDLLTYPIAEVHLPGVPIKSTSEIVLSWVGSGLSTLVHIMPELCGLFAMGFLLFGMTGSQRAMRYAGTSVLLAFVGVMLNVAIS
ncbi:MAG: M23 family metallopeptidase [Janthinobacterium sp.]|jgi:murein DD-endopeptidase MepM/ murein hydrolase activator NlpD